MKPPTMTNEQFAVITKLLSELAGLAFEESRRDSIGYSIGERMRATGCKDVSAYLHLLFAADATAERQALLDEVTIPETHFFRNPPQIRALRTGTVELFHLPPQPSRGGECHEAGPLAILTGKNRERPVADQL